MHGLLQSVSQHYLQLISTGAVVSAGNRGSLTNIVFSHSIYLGILKCITGNLRHDVTYTLVADPQWRLDSLFAFYQKFYQAECEVQFVDHPRCDRLPGLQLSSRAMLELARGVLEPVMIQAAPWILPSLKRYFPAQVCIDCEPPGANGKAAVICWERSPARFSSIRLLRLRKR